MTIRDILVVDDSKTELVYLSNILIQNGYLVRTAMSAEQAMEKLAQGIPDLILLDVIMPGMNGFQLTRRLKHQPAYANIPIIMCTSKDQPTDKFWGIRQGAVAYLVKPVAAEALLSEIMSLISKNGESAKQVR